MQSSTQIIQEKIDNHEKNPKVAYSMPSRRRCNVLNACQKSHNNSPQSMNCIDD